MNNRRITLKDLYCMYTYKWYDINSSTVPSPYFPKNEITEHKHTLDYKTWRMVVQCLLKYYVLYIMSGKAFKIPHYLGSFILKKWKPKGKNIDFHKTHERYGELNKSLPKGQKKVIYHNNHHTRGYSPILKWMRDSQKFPFKWHWRFELSQDNFKKISDQLVTEPSMINRLIDA